MEQNNDKLEYTKQLMERALKNEHSPKELLSNIVSLFAARAFKIATKTTSDAFYTTANKLLKDYLKKSKQDIDNPQLLVSYRQFKHCAEFYKSESELAENMISEFHNYMLTYGNFINTMLGFDRPDDKMYEYVDIGEMKIH